MREIKPGATAGNKKIPEYFDTEEYASLLKIRNQLTIINLYQQSHSFKVK